MLALDGGGLLGLISLGLLAEIEAQFRDLYGDPNLRLRDVFDYIGGTSTGAIIAAGLALGRSVAELRSLYLTRGAEIFSREIWPVRALTGYAYRYSAEGIGRVLRDEIGEKSILELQLAGLLSSDRHLMIIARNKTTNSCWPLTSQPSARYNDSARDDCNRRVPLWRLVRASTAAPFYFPPEFIRLDWLNPNKWFHFEDGGLTAHNNPALKLFQMATAPEYGLGWAAGERNLAIISVGTGRNERRRKDIRDVGDSIVGIGKRTPQSLMSGISAENDLSCRLTGRCVHGYRIDSEVGDLIPSLPLSQDTGRAFLYARYDADLSDSGLKAVGLSAADWQLELDRVKSMSLFDRIGQAFRPQVRLADHFGDILTRARKQVD